MSIILLQWTTYIAVFTIKLYQQFKPIYLFDCSSAYRRIPPKKNCFKTMDNGKNKDRILPRHGISLANTWRAHSSLTLARRVSFKINKSQINGLEAHSLFKASTSSILVRLLSARRAKTVCLDGVLSARRTRQGSRSRHLCRNRLLGRRETRYRSNARSLRLQFFTLETGV